MLGQIIENKHYTFKIAFDSWEDAIRASCEPLIKDGSVDPSYADEIIECVKKYGPYIVIAPMIALPHAQENARGVHKTAVSFMKVEEVVKFDEEDREKDAKLFFTIASENHDKHLENLTRLAEMLSNQDIVDELLDAKSLEDLKAIVSKYNL